MKYVLEGQTFADADSFVAALNKERQAAPKAWLAFVGMVGAKSVRIKTYGTGYLQILEVDGIKHGAPMDMNVTGWKETIRKAVA